MNALALSSSLAASAPSCGPWSATWTGAVGSNGTPTLSGAAARAAGTSSPRKIAAEAHLGERLPDGFRITTKCGRPRCMNLGCFILPIPESEFPLKRAEAVVALTDLEWAVLRRHPIVVSPDGCWLSEGPPSRNGYVRIQWRSQPDSLHRIVYTHWVGDLEPSMTVDHLCHNAAAKRNKNRCRGGDGCPHRQCVNPAHLGKQTINDNLRNSANTFQAKNAAKTHCPKGHPLVGENLRPSGLKHGWRQCQVCEWVQSVKRVPCPTCDWAGALVAEDGSLSLCPTCPPVNHPNSNGLRNRGWLR